MERRPIRKVSRINEVKMICLIDFNAFFLIFKKKTEKVSAGFPIYGNRYDMRWMCRFRNFVLKKFGDKSSAT